jgi:ABC-type Mn2+/Zn2+ transport system permease subunit
MLDLIRELLSYSFILRALTVGMLVALCSALLGVSLVLKRYSMIGDGLSHVGFGALSVAMVMNLAPLQVSIPVVVAAAFLLLRISENSKIKGDAAIALISSSSIAIGVIVTSLTSGMSADVYNFLFGSILAMSRGDVLLSVILSFIVLLMFIFFYHKIFAVTFDENFARATGTKVGLYNMMIALLTAVTIVVGMRIMGSLLISSLIIFPALSSMRVFRSFRGVIITSAIISMVCFFWGITASYAFDTPAGASIVVVNLLVFGICCVIGLIPRGEKE